MKFRKKPVAIEAFLFDMRDTVNHEPPQWFKDKMYEGKINVHLTYCDIRTLEGTMRAEAGDWIIQGVKGEIYPCKPDIFAATYEREDGSPI